MSAAVLQECVLRGLSGLSHQHPDPQTVRGNTQLDPQVSLQLLFQTHCCLIGHILSVSEHDHRLHDDVTDDKNVS